MKLIAPADRDPASGRTVKPKKLNWKREWIEDQPRFVLLACGHRDSMSLRGTLLVNMFTGIEMYCSRCLAFSRIKKKIGLLEYHGIKRVKAPDVPLY